MNKNLFLNQRGAIFLSTLIATFLMTLVGGYMYQLATSDLHLVHRMENAAQAQQLADAGLAKALSIIKNSWAARNVSSNFTSTTLSPGSFSTAVTTSGGRTLVTTTGVVQGVSRTASAEVSAPSSGAMNYAIAGGSIALNMVGQAYLEVDHGSIYADGNISLGAQAGDAHIQLQAPGAVDAGGTVSTSGAGTITTGTRTSSAALASWPTPNFSYYQNIAQNGGGTYYASSHTFSTANSIPSPAGRVVFVNGDVTISAAQSTTAAIVATGSITISAGTLNISQPSNYVALMTQNGAITFTGTGNSNPSTLHVTGMIYSGNNFTITGNHHHIDLTGQILARGALTMNDNGGADNHIQVSYQSSSVGGMTGGQSGSMTIKSYNA